MKITIGEHIKESKRSFMVVDLVHLKERGIRTVRQLDEIFINPLGTLENIGSGKTSEAKKTFVENDVP